MRRLFLIIILLLPARVFADELIIVSPHWEGVRYEFGRAFAAYYQERTGREINVRWRDLGGTSQIEKALNASFAATPDSAQIDVLFGGGYDSYITQKARGQLQAHRLPDEIRALIPTAIGGFTIIDEDEMFFGAALAAFGILQNEVVLRRAGKAAVIDWESLCRPELSGWVSAADPRKSGAFHMIYEIILQAYGWERGWRVIYQMSGNVAAFLDNAGAPAKEVALGNAVAAPALDTYGFIQESYLGVENVSFVLPRELSVINPDCIAILKGAPNPAAAAMFVDFVMSKRGQTLWMRPRGTPGGPARFDIARMSVMPALYDDPGTHSRFNPFRQNYSFPYRAELGAARWGVVNDLIGQTIIDVHPRLRAAWQAILRLPADRREPFIAELVKPFVTEEEASRLAERRRADPAGARAVAEQWMKDAVARYKNLEQQAREEQP